MKRLLSVALGTALALALAAVPARAAMGDVVGHIYVTDIVATIDGLPIRSYNIGGETAIVVEDLSRYGFQPVWHAETRTLTVERDLSIPVSGSAAVQTPPQGAAGAVAGDIYDTDIKTYLQGEEVEGFNIGGETAIRLTELERVGQVTWDPETRTAALALSEDPMELTLERLEQQAREQQAQGGFSSACQRYPNTYGVLLERTDSGMPQGEVTTLTQVYTSGRVLDVGALLPACPEAYLAPREIQAYEASMYLTFLTPVKEWLDDGVGTIQDYGECRCVLNLSEGTLDWTPLGAPLEDWSVKSGGGTVAPDAPLTMTITRAQGEAWEASAVQISLPSQDVNVTVEDDKLTIVHWARFTVSAINWEEWADTPYKRAFWALEELDLPRITQDNFSRTNSPQQREQAAQWFRLTLNGEPVSGDLWWSQGNNHSDLIFTYDQPIGLREGDELTLWIGVPQEN